MPGNQSCHIFPKGSFLALIQNGFKQVGSPWRGLGTALILRPHQPPGNMELRLKMLLNLLYAAVAMLLFILTGTVGYALSDGPAAAPVPDPVELSAPNAASSELARLGKKVWNANVCGSCYNKNMKDDATGPALRGVAERWAGYPREDLYAWIRNSQALIATKHPRAVEVYEANNRGQMSSYLSLTDEEIEGLLAYIEMEYADH